MKTFQKDGKINFVDDNNVFVGFDNSQCCCENFGWMITKEKPLSEDDQQNEKDEGADGFCFDTKFMESSGDSDGGGQVTFRLAKGKKQRFLTLWNHHNGYYSHGFEMENDMEIFHRGML